MLLATYVTLHNFLGDLHRQATERVTRNEDGSITLEQAVIASALFVAAIGLLAVIVRAIQARADQIS